MPVENLTDVGPRDFIQNFGSEAGFFADLLPRFRHFLTLDLATSEYLSQLNQQEKNVEDGLATALEIISPIIKAMTFAAFTDILDYGSDNEALEALGLLEFYNIYQREGISKIGEIVGEDAVGKSHKAVDSLQAAIQGLDYEATYLGGFHPAG